VGRRRPATHLPLGMTKGRVVASICIRWLVEGSAVLSTSLKYQG
jgi:hypothetical protein